MEPGVDSGTAPPPAPSGEPVHGKGDAHRAFRNAAKLGGSLILTWGIALAVRLLMPRFLGPDAWGPINFADAFTTTFFLALMLGIDGYIRMEVSVHPEKASGFMGGVTLVRAVLVVLIFLAMQAVLVWTDRPREVWPMVWAFGAANVFTALSQTFAALLHARGTVNELSVLNIVSKVLWGGGVLATLALKWPLWGVPLALAASEGLKTVVSFVLVRRHLALEWRWDTPAVKTALWVSAPMFLNGLAHGIYNKLDVSILAVVAGDREVAWYGASSMLAGLTLMVTPMIGWVLVPLFARARARSEDEYTKVMRRSLELVLQVAIPTSLMTGLGAEFWVTALYGPAYAPAAASLRVLSPLFVLTYVAIISANSLMLTGRGWTQAFISIAGLGVNPFLNWLFVRRAMGWFGEGGAGIGAALAQLGTELTVTTVMTWFVGARAFDLRTLGSVARAIGVCLAVIALDHWVLAGLSPLVKVVLDALAYVALAVAVRAVDVRELIAFAKEALREKRAARSPEHAEGPALEGSTP